MTASIPTRLERLERDRCPGCEDPRPLPDHQACLDQPMPNRAEGRAIVFARTEQLLAAVWPRAIGGDARAAATAVRLLDQQARVLLPTHDRDSDRSGIVPLEELLRLADTDDEGDA
ncbi:hypothetical protein ABZ697_31375 [Streptomyces albidoflavus]|uniref:hypothetical protein n=1 Tax=Streptomyces albidoflavus TaxID=1886 RepID=UPI0033F02475